MSRVFLFDSNIYIRGFREVAFGRELREFHRAELSRLVVSAVVASELWVGVRRPDRERALRRTLIDILIAASARELGATIITVNLNDFALIGRHVDITYVGPWPLSAPV